MTKEYLSWQRVFDMTEQLARKIQKKPDVVLGIIRGGMIPARLVQNYFPEAILTTIGCKRYRNDKVMHENCNIYSIPGFPLQEKRVLIVDDVADEGITLQAVEECCFNFEASEVYTAVLHYKPHCAVKPDYFVEKTSNWIVYPWEAEE